MKTKKRTKRIAAVSLLNLILFSVTSFADSYKLVPSESTIQYDIKATGVGAVKGLLDKSKSTLTGNLAGTDFSEAKDLRGEVNISDCYFNTDTSARDEHVKEMMSGPIKMTLKSGISKSAPGLYQVPVSLLWNGITHDLIAKAKSDAQANAIVIQGVLDLNRQDFNVTPKGWHKILDGAIDNNLRISYKLKFEKE
jgi:polyisoprenoid-binding protein YceI